MGKGFVSVLLRIEGGEGFSFNRLFLLREPLVGVLRLPHDKLPGLRRAARDGLDLWGVRHCGKET